MKSFLRRIHARWQATEVVVAGTALAVIIFLGGVQIILRNFADSGWIWAEAVIRHLVLVVGFVGGSLAAAQNRHITIDALSRLLAGRWLRAARILTVSAAALISIALFTASVHFVYMEQQEGTNLLAGWLPVWVVQLVIPYTFLSVAIRLVGGLFANNDASKQTEEAR